MPISADPMSGGMLAAVYVKAVEAPKLCQSVSRVTPGWL
jgi:hypothetical protein